jgi:hypothetical protein
MQYDVAAGVASRLSLGDYFAQILKGEAAPALAEAAGSSPYWAQYNPDADYGIDRAEDLPDSDLTDVFEPEEGPAP